MSLSQSCSILFARLLHIRGFSSYASLVPPTNDPITQLWDILALGFPLCFLFDLLPEDAGFNKINHSEIDQERYDSNPDRAKKQAIALFAIHIQRVTDHIPGCEAFIVADIWDRSSTDRFTKVVATVTALVNYLPPNVFVTPAEKIPTYVPLPSRAQDTQRNNIIRELVETERKFVQDLDHLRSYATVVAQSNLIDQETDRGLFANTIPLFQFQRKFLDGVNANAELPWQEQRWGLLFLKAENEFAEIYAPYCANWTNITSFVLTPEQERNLSTLNHLIHVKSELPAFLIKPIGRVCKYPLLIEFLIKATSAAGYQHYEELKRGLQAAKRVTDIINEAQRQAENDSTVKSLRTRIDSWKGHNPDDFGPLLLDDVLVVVRAGVKREYHVFLFENIALFCKQAPPYTRRANNTGPLLNKGRILMSSVTGTASGLETEATSPSVPRRYALTVHWKGEDGPEFLTLCLRTEDHMRRWGKQINKLQGSGNAQSPVPSPPPDTPDSTSPIDKPDAHPRPRGSKSSSTTPPSV
ncbi:Dbl homology domain-containing protein [Mycena filopes]|nr:Dbl homology domain-containing protein [Mycena filopes]